MPSAYSGSNLRLDVKALEQHLLDIGLIPKSSKWLAVWHRKKHKFMKARK